MILEGRDGAAGVDPNRAAVLTLLEGAGIGIAALLAAHRSCLGDVPHHALLLLFEVWLSAIPLVGCARFAGMLRRLIIDQPRFLCCENSIIGWFLFGISRFYVGAII